jgi:putative ABC transport system permease protein
MFLLVFAMVALFVGSFIIYNTFSILVAQRGKEMALMRAIGASRRQVLGSILFEAVVVGLVASISGIVAGVGVASLLKARRGEAVES